jgi:hypothetical protein
MSRIPEQLMERLRRANEHLHHARMRLDGVDMLGTEEARAAAKDIREAERELEDVTHEIDGFLPHDHPGQVSGV